MRILVYGAGNMGSLYATLLGRSGQDVTILARGRRLADIREHGLRLEPALGGAPTDVVVDVVARLGGDDAYDLVLVALPRDEVTNVLGILGASRRTPSVMFFGNNAAGPAAMVEALGRDRVLLGFPGAAAVRHEGRLGYLITSAREQPTTMASSTVPRPPGSGLSHRPWRPPDSPPPSARTWTPGSRPTWPRSALPRARCTRLAQTARDSPAHATPR